MYVRDSRVYLRANHILRNVSFAKPRYERVTKSKANGYLITRMEGYMIARKRMDQNKIIIVITMVTTTT